MRNTPWKIILLCTLGILLTSCSVSKHSQSISGMGRLPEPSILFHTLDSIVNEAWQLYYSERTNWIASDFVLESHSMDELGGTISWQPNDSVWAVAFLDKEKRGITAFLSTNTTLLQKRCFLWIPSDQPQKWNWLNWNEGTK